MMKLMVHNDMINTMNENIQSCFALHFSIITVHVVFLTLDRSESRHLSGRNVFQATLNKRSIGADVAKIFSCQNRETMKPFRSSFMGKHGSFMI